MVESSPTMAEDYRALLDRAHQLLPPVRVATERFQIPDPDVMTDGKNTVIRNFKEITDVLRREPEHVMGYLARELGAPRRPRPPEGVLKSRVNREQIAQRLREYSEKYVICSECKRPDTHLSKDGPPHAPDLRGVRCPAARDGPQSGRADRSRRPRSSSGKSTIFSSRTSDDGAMASRRRRGS